MTPEFFGLNTLGRGQGGVGERESVQEESWIAEPTFALCLKHSFQ